MKKHNEGFSLIETVVAMAILGLIMVPCCSALLLSIRINDKAQQTMQAQLAVSSAVETLMAEGIDKTIANNGEKDPDEGWISYDYYSVQFSGSTADAEKGDVDHYPGVEILIRMDDSGSFCEVKVSDDEALVTIDTSIRTVESKKEVADEQEA